MLPTTPPRSRIPGRLSRSQAPSPSFPPLSPSYGHGIDLPFEPSVSDDVPDWAANTDAQAILDALARTAPYASAHPDAAPSPPAPVAPDSPAPVAPGSPAPVAPGSPAPVAPGSPAAGVADTRSSDLLARGPAPFRRALSGRNYAEDSDGGSGSDSDDDDDEGEAPARHSYDVGGEVACECDDGADAEDTWSPEVPDERTQEEIDAYLDAFLRGAGDGDTPSAADDAAPDDRARADDSAPSGDVDRNGWNDDDADDEPYDRKLYADDYSDGAYTEETAAKRGFDDDDDEYVDEDIAADTDDDDDDDDYCPAPRRPARRGGPRPPPTPTKADDDVGNQQGRKRRRPRSASPSPAILSPQKGKGPAKKRRTGKHTPFLTPAEAGAILLEVHPLVRAAVAAAAAAVSFAAVPDADGRTESLCQFPVSPGRACARQASTREARQRHVLTHAVIPSGRFRGKAALHVCLACGAAINRPDALTRHLTLGCAAVHDERIRACGGILARTFRLALVAESDIMKAAHLLSSLDAGQVAGPSTPSIAGPSTPNVAGPSA